MPVLFARVLDSRSYWFAVISFSDLNPWPSLGLALAKVGSKSKPTRKDKNAGLSFLITTGLTFCLYVRLFYEAPLHSPFRLNISQLDLVSKSCQSGICNHYATLTEYL